MFKDSREFSDWLITKGIHHGEARSFELAVDVEIARLKKIRREGDAIGFYCVEIAESIEGGVPGLTPYHVLGYARRAEVWAMATLLTTAVRYLHGDTETSARRALVAELRAHAVRG